MIHIALKTLNVVIQNNGTIARPRDLLETNFSKTLNSILAHPQYYGNILFATGIVLN